MSDFDAGGLTDLGSYIKSLNEKITLLEGVVSELNDDVRISRKRRFYRKTQSVSLNSMSRALCVATIDPLLEHRVQFYHPVLHEPDSPVRSLPYAKPVSPMGGFDDCGLMWVPPAGSTLVIVFENGNRFQPYYLGTTWHRSRGPKGRDFGVPVKEYFQVHDGNRGGYLIGPDDESQVLPSWNTESYNCRDFDNVRQFESDPEARHQITVPNIYGMKTPGKHAIKLTDGNPLCNNRGMRVEIMSGGGGWIMLKDDHLHHGMQVAHPSCGGLGGDDISKCSNPGKGEDFFTSITGEPIEKTADCDGKSSSANILGGHPSTPGKKGETKHFETQKGSNKFFKHQNECRPYKGPGTPQNNRCDLPQSGIQVLSISGQSIVLDDSVEEPRGKPSWKRSTEPFDFGCNDTFAGRMALKSATGHGITLNDVEKSSGLRGENNGIKIETATGNRIELNDHTAFDAGCKPCPPNYAGEKRGITIESTSKHKLVMNDSKNLQCSPCRKEGGIPENNATAASLELKSGYGMSLKMSDDFHQKKTQSQWMQLTHQQKAADGDADDSANRERGPHFLRFQGRPQGEPGIIFLRAGGHSVRQTYDMDIVLVGDPEKNPSDKFTYVSKKHIRATEDVDYRYSGQLHIFFAEKYILLMAGRDNPPAEGKKCCSPGLYPVVIGRCAKSCPFTGWAHFTEKSLSERVFASGYNDSICSGGSGQCPPGGEAQPCEEDPENQEDRYRERRRQPRHNNGCF
jgi:hypothetical protein